MTENEALNTLHILLAHEKAIDAGEIISPNNLHSKEALHFILEEIQQYREIGTVKELQSKLEAYRELGTIEELKDLKEKSEPKKAILSRKHHEAYCPNCHFVISEDEFYLLDEYVHYCEDCGQAVKGIDWK